MRVDSERLNILDGAKATGAVSEVAYEQAEREIFDTRVSISILQRQLQIQQDTLAVLLGEAPGNWIAPRLKLEDINLPADVPLQLPSGLARRRPDIRAAAQLLNRTTRRVHVTEDGALYYDHCIRILSEVSEAESALEAPRPARD